MGETTVQTLKRGDMVKCRGEFASQRSGLVTRVAKDGSWVDVFWGGWSKRMLASGLYKPKEVVMPGLSGNGMTTTLLQFDGEDGPAAGVQGRE